MYSDGAGWGSEAGGILGFCKNDYHNHELYFTKYNSYQFLCFLALCNWPGLWNWFSSAIITFHTNAKKMMLKYATKGNLLN